MPEVETLSIENMDISTLISNFIGQNIQSEKEVCSKLLGPLTELLGYPQNMRSEEFPVYGSSGRERLHPKDADFLLFDDADFASHRTRNGLDWVYKHSLLVVEAKRPTENLDNIGQPVFYSAWTRSIAYILCNGVYIEAYLINANFSDSLICSCRVEEIPQHWNGLNRINFASTKNLKEEAQGKYSSWISRNFYDDYINVMAERCCKELTLAVDRNLVQIDRRVKEDLGKEVTVQNIVNEGKSIVISSEPGGGKSYFLWILMREFLHGFHENGQRIPVLLQGRYYARKWSSVKEGIYQEVQEILPATTREMLDRQVREGNFVILFDGLDEVLSDQYDLLVDELYQINRSTATTLVLTCREQNYRDDFTHGFIHCRLLPLNEQQIHRYLSQYTNGETALFYRLPAAFCELLSNPLYLVMFCAVASCKEDFQIPKNTSTLFQKYCTERMKALGCDLFRINQINSVLQSYAIYSYENEDSDKEFFELLNTKFPVSEAHSIYNIIWKSGIIISEKEGIRFFHKALQEYFYAMSLSDSDSDGLQNWLIEHSRDENYYEIICYLTGMISDQQKQNHVLDYLEVTNIRLFVRALNSRHNFGGVDIEISEEFAQHYFSQVLTTYQHLIVTFFDRIATIFDGYEGDIGKPALLGVIDPDAESIRLQIYCTNMEAASLETHLSKGNKAVITYKDGFSSPIYSSVFTSGGMHIRYYDLHMLSYGFDSSREIAVDIIKKQIEDVLQHKKIFDIFDFLLPPDEKEYMQKLGAGPDREFPKRKYSCRFDELYSNEQLVKRVRVIMDTVQNTIDQIHDSLLPVLKTVAPRRRIIGTVYREGEHTGFGYIGVKVKENEDISSIINFSKNCIGLEDLKDSYYLQKVFSIGKSEKDIIFTGCSMLSLYFQKNSIHEVVNNELKKEFKVLWEAN